MSVILVRIDDRLVHGQVVESWIPFFKAKHVVVVSDAAAADPTQRMLMRLALPEAVGLEVLSQDGAAEFLSGLKDDSLRVLVLAPGPREVLGLLERGIKFDTVNVGGMHYSAGRVRLGRVIFLGDDDRRTLRAIAERGVALEGRAVPSDTVKDLRDLLDETVKR